MDLYATIGRIMNPVSNMRTLQIIGVIPSALPEVEEIEAVEAEAQYGVPVGCGLTFGESAEILAWPELSPEDKDCWIVGFDCAHYADTPENCPKDYVISQAKSLAEQLTAMWPANESVESAQADSK